MQRMQGLDRFGVFANPENSEILTSVRLERALSATVYSIVAYEPYLYQVNLDKLFAKSNPRAESLIHDYIEKCDINASNNLGVTLLHILLWSERPDLAHAVVNNPKFNKINFKFCIPFDMTIMYASALDLAIGFWTSNDSAINLDFIESLLAHGAIPPDPAKKFLSGEFVSEIYPLIILGHTELSDMKEVRSPEDMKSLFCLLYRYGFSIEKMEAELRRRLFNTQNSWDNCAAEFADVYDIPIEKQKAILDDFMLKLYAAKENLKLSKVVVDLDEARLNDGKGTLNLPFDPNYRPCSIM